jgi:hypothetical protein
VFVPTAQEITGDCRTVSDVMSFSLYPSVGRLIYVSVLTKIKYVEETGKARAICIENIARKDYMGDIAVMDK